MFFYQNINDLKNTGLSQEEHFFKFDYNNYCYDMFDNEFIIEFMKLKKLGEINISESEEKRPDLLSYKIYRDVKYWWLLMMFNEILDSDLLLKDKTIKFFDISDLNKLIMKMSLKQKKINKE